MKIPKQSWGWRNEALFSDSGVFPSTKKFKKTVVHSKDDIYGQPLREQKMFISKEIQYSE